MAIAHEWTWFHEYLGNQKLICEQSITEPEIIEYLNSLYTSSDLIRSHYVIVLLKSLIIKHDYSMSEVF